MSIKRFGPDGAAQGVVTLPVDQTARSIAGLGDGGVVVRTTTYQNPNVTGYQYIIFSKSGSTVAVLPDAADLLSNNLDVARIPSGFVGISAIHTQHRDVVNGFSGFLYDPLPTQFYTQTFTKDAVPLVPLAAPNANMRAPASVQTIPGVATNTPVASPTPPAPPPVVFGSGSGATFAGVSGCNASVCSPEILAARALIDAERAASRSDSSPSAAAEAVRALQRAQQIQGIVNPGAGPIGTGMLIRDMGEMQRLTQQLAEFYKTATPAQIRDTAAAADTVLRAFLEREELTQRLGVNAANPNEVRQVDLILNMSQAERVEYFEKIATELRLGTPN
jgi:hypothetical protein